MDWRLCSPSAWFVAFTLLLTFASPFFCFATRNYTHAHTFLLEIYVYVFLTQRISVNWYFVRERRVAGGGGERMLRA
jgi:hypothetical protein